MRQNEFTTPVYRVGDGTFFSMLDVLEHLEFKITAVIKTYCDSGWKIDRDKDVKKVMSSTWAYAVIKMRK